MDVAGRSEADVLGLWLGAEMTPLRLYLSAASETSG